MIKITPFFPGDAAQVRALLRYQEEPVPFDAFVSEEKVINSKMSFWQHWVPIAFHRTTSVYLAKEDNTVLGLIALDSLGRSNHTWQVNQLVVHPRHRGRGIAEELLRYALALFGGQGISHFLCEVSNQNSSAISLLVSCGFRRCSRISYYQVPIDYSPPEVNYGDADFSAFRIAQPPDGAKIYALHQEIIPPEERRIFNFVAEDYRINDVKMDRSRFKLEQSELFWVTEETERQVIPCAARVKTSKNGDHLLEFYVNSGWSHLACDLVNFVVGTTIKAQMQGMVVIKVFDFQDNVAQALSQLGLEPSATCYLMAKEQWMRAKKKKRLRLDPTVTLPSMGKPAINIPYMSDSNLNLTDS
ncbi:MAG: GNAT family N-acetyltransferase [Cyanobacteria bacterium TGS_CYA1]|nr:GNAT family N-acetyltransferase [Cyanobacteria bacterium TGS_CYA1]